MSLVEDVPALSESIWPYDTAQAPDTSPPRQFDKFRCFVLCPFRRADVTLLIVRQAAAELEEFLGHQMEVYYAGDMAGPGTVHSGIWVHTRQADIVVADVTGYNPNVLYELGVAAAWRPIESVIILRDESDEAKPAFDLVPARQRLYDSKFLGWADQLRASLARDMLHCLSRVPFRDEPVQRPPGLPLQFSFQDGQDTPVLWAPGPGHRRLVKCSSSGSALEFGSPFFFPYSWVSPAGMRLADVRIRAEMSFTDLFGSSWIGVAVRSQGYLSNYEHLAWLGSDGVVHRTGPGIDPRTKDEHEVGRLSDFDPSARQFVVFDICMNRAGWSIRVGDVQQEVPLKDLPHVFPQGRVLLQTANCRAALKGIRIEEPKRLLAPGGRE